MKKLIDIIYETRMRTGLTQAEFARMIGISQPYYSRIERGDVQPGIELVEKMMFRLNLKVVPRTIEDVEILK
jgi:transcriptional regulator with XRE-family HTH domain